jgi:predicted metal-dependent hydrolase
MPEYAYGSTVIPYTLEYRDRKTVAIEVHPDASVHVKAPTGARLEQIEAKVGKRASWIDKQRKRFEEYAPPLSRRRYVSGEGYRYLGKQYRLKVAQGENRVRLWRGYLEATTPDPADAGQIEKLVIKWLRSRARQVFEERYAECLRNAHQHGVEHEGGFELLQMPKRWGSCTKDGRILLNPALVSAPKDCIDYVITHELCHTVEHNHSARFYALLTRVMLDWEVRKARLDRQIEAQV